MFEKRLFADKVKQMNMTLWGVAADAGMSYTTLYRKMNGTSDFTRGEVQRLRKIMRLNAAETEMIFFA